MPHKFYMMFKTIILSLIGVCLSIPALGETFDRIAQAEILQGWRNIDGSHTAALRITLKPGWKTYWRAPGDSGIPPRIDWFGSRNFAEAKIEWPTPEVFQQNGMRSIGYTDELILPIQIQPRTKNRSIRLKAVLDIGVCRDICVPQQLTVKADLPKRGKRDARIAAALADRPLTMVEAGVTNVKCSVSATADGLLLTSIIKMPSMGPKEIAIVEIDNPQIWVGEGEIQRSSGILTAQTELQHVEGLPFLLDRSSLRFTVLGKKSAVDIRGCAN